MLQNLGCAPLSGSTLWTARAVLNHGQHMQCFRATLAAHVVLQGNTCCRCRRAGLRCTGQLTKGTRRWWARCWARALLSMPPGWCARAPAQRLSSGMAERHKAHSGRAAPPAGLSQTAQNFCGTRLRAAMRAYVPCDANPFAQCQVVAHTHHSPLVM
jgi:hypothetical protein